MAAWANVYDTAELSVGAATIVQVRRRGKGCLSYVVGSGDEAYVVDPSIAISHYLEVAAEKGWRITKVFDTHLHADHLSGAPGLAEATGASLYLNPADTFAFRSTARRRPLRTARRRGLAVGRGAAYSRAHAGLDDLLRG